ncbi:MAG: hypothetical protein ABI574_04750 [Burkholderiales bacterium]
MKGNNELRLNLATMIEAVQMWLDCKMPCGAPTVTRISFSGDTFGVFVSSDVDRPTAVRRHVGLPKTATVLATHEPQN